MLIVLFQDKNISIRRKKIRVNDLLPNNTIWIDLIEPDIQEEKYIENILNIQAPSEEEMEKIEVTSPYYEKKGVNYMTTTVIDRNSTNYPDSIAITFILTKEYLITIRYDRPKSFDYLNSWISRNKSSGFTHALILVCITGFIIDCCADITEEVGNETDKLINMVFNKSFDNNEKSSDFYNKIIRSIGITGNIISKSRECLMSLHRMIIFFSQINNADYMTRKNIKIKVMNISREIESLEEYVNFLSQRNSFLLDATLGIIYVEQNIIIKVFTMAAAIFMPPTLIAGIYGMNFNIIPELNFKYGYGMSLILMVFSAIIPYIYFKHKRWL